MDDSRMDATTFAVRLAHLQPSVLAHDLASLRVGVDRLAAKLCSEGGESDEASQRAEQLSAAIQRLEWALERRKLRDTATHSAA
jgi:hypothetical protein